VYVQTAQWRPWRIFRATDVGLTMSGILIDKSIFITARISSAV